MYDKYLIQHCSPTLAGIKTGSLFSCTFNCEKSMNEHLSKWNSELNPKGVQITVLKKTNNKYLIYVYRPGMLNTDIKNSEASDFLLKLGYDDIEINNCLNTLTKRLSENKFFPHEIGLFLGYPLPDIKHFIEYQGKNSKCTGCWKVYCNEHEAIKIFKKYKKCTQKYFELFTKGKTILGLTVAHQI